MKMKVTVGVVTVLLWPMLALAQPPQQVQGKKLVMEELFFDGEEALAVPPDSIIRPLVESIHRGDLVKAGEFVLNARPDVILPAEILEHIKLVDWSVQNVRSLQSEEQAVVLFDLHVKIKLDVEFPTMDGEKLDKDAQTTLPNSLLLQKSTLDRKWRVIPASPDTLLDLERKGNFILFAATLLSHPEAEKGWRERTLTERVRSNLRRISRLAHEFAQDHNNKLALNSKTYIEQLLPYTKTDEIFHLPGIELRRRYSFNQHLENVELHHLFEHGASLVLFYTGQNEQLDFPYQDRAAVAFADGSVKLISREEAKTLRWKP